MSNIDDNESNIKQDIITELINLEIAELPQILNAMQNVINPNDINVVTEYIMNENNKLENDELMQNVNTCNEETTNNDVYSENAEKLILIDYYLTFEEANQLKVNDKIDHQDISGLYDQATIMTKNGTNLKIHYDAWSEEYDEWSDYSIHLGCFAKRDSFTKNLLLNHDYKKYFDIKEYNDDTFDIINEKLKTCMLYIKNIVVPAVKATSYHLFKQWLQSMYFHLFERFISIDLKPSLSKLYFDKLVAEFDNTYLMLLKNICMQTDIKHLQIENEIIRNDKKQIHSEDIKKEMISIKMKWYAINDDKYNEENDQKEDEYHEYEEFIYDNNGRYIDDIICNEDIDICIPLKRINHLLLWFNKYFLNYFEKQPVPQTKQEKLISFIEIFELLSNIRINNNKPYNLVQLINDFQHIKDLHIGSLSKEESNSLFTECDIIDQCLCNHRDELDQQYQTERKNKRINYCGLTDIHEINIIQHMMKIHTFLSHRQYIQMCPVKNDNDNNNDVKLIKMRSMISKQFYESRNRDKCSKFSTEIDDFNQNDAEEQEKEVVFQFGHQFFYWKHFKYGTESDYFIEKPYFPNLKEEILCNNICTLSLHLWKTELLNATKYKICNKGKQLRARNDGAGNKEYEMPVNCPISISHLMSILFYTNYTELQYKFKKYGTRKITKDDTINEIKKRNAQIGNWYKLLYEVTELFAGDTEKKITYYHGLSIQMMMPSFSPIFEAPISTTTSINMAQTFAKNGIILCLNTNNEESGCMDVSWISQYPQEKERLFGSIASLYINDIRFIDINANINFNITNTLNITAIRLLDTIFCSNCYYSKKQIKKKVQHLLLRFIKNYYYHHASLTLMDEIVKYIDTHPTTKHIQQFITEENYDSDALMEDIDDDIHNKSNINKQFINKNDYQLFKNMIYENDIKIPTYLAKLFLHKLNILKNKKTIFMIKSEYIKLNQTLKNELLNFDDNNKIKLSPFLSNFIDPQCVKLMHEFIWNIEGEEFEQFMAIKIEEKHDSPIFSFKLCDGGNVTLRIEMNKITSSLPDHAGVSIRILSLPSNISSLSISWCYIIPQTKFITPPYKWIANEGDVEGWKSCKNKLFQSLNNIQVKLSIAVHEELRL